MYRINWLKAFAVSALLVACGGESPGEGGGEGAAGSCGDGVLDLLGGEQCDDGNLIDGDGCSALCQTEDPGGDEEICDNEADDDGDGDVDCADSDCAESDACASEEVCDSGEDDDGDGDVDCADSDCADAEECATAELCDNGEDDDGDGDVDCDDADCADDAACASTEDCENGEDDDGDGDVDCDDADCTCETDCGDGVVDEGEECDDGDANSGTEPDACRTDCTFARCGDGVIDTGETCDEGPANGGLTCSDTCQLPANDCPVDPFLINLSPAAVSNTWSWTGELSGDAFEADASCAERGVTGQRPSTPLRGAALRALPCLHALHRGRHHALAPRGVVCRRGERLQR